MSSPKRRARLETNGAVAAPIQTVSSTVSASVSPSLIKSKHQTDGSYIPLTGPITNVRQLTRGPRSLTRNSIESFASLSDYTAHLKNLSLGELNRHAVEDARVVPIDDRDRLIRRLENNWTEVSARETARCGESVLPARPDFTDEQKAKQEAIRRRMLGGRA